MNHIEKDLAPFIEERLQISFKDLRKTKEYENLKETYCNLDIKISNLLKSDTKLYNKIKDASYSMQSLELHRTYLLGFLDGIRLDEHLRKKN